MNKWLVIVILLMGADAQAWDCAFDRELDQSLDVSGSEVLAIAAGAGDLVINGLSGAAEVKIRGKICVSREEWLDEAKLEAVPGKRAEINVVLPDTGDGWSLWGNRYAYIDLVLDVPESLALQVRDSSGDIEMTNVYSVEIKDSSGDIDINGAGGAVQIADSSGDIEVSDLQGDFTIVSDSSGDILGEDIEGEVLVVADSSGDIRFTGVGQGVTVEKDSSGDINARNVKGDVRVLKDSSGDISTSEIGGDVIIPEHKK